MRYWRRAATLTIGSRRYNLDDLAFSFETDQDDKGLPICKLEVTNLARFTRASIQKGVPIVLAAGYRDDAGTIFVGKVSEVSHSPGDVDVVTKITAADSVDAWLRGNVNKTYKGPTTAQEVLDDLLAIFGVEVALCNLAVNKEYPRGRVCVDKLKDVIGAIVKECGSKLIIRNSQVVIKLPEEGVTSGYLLSPETGLLKSSESKDAQSTATDEDKTIKHECLLNYHLGVGDRVVIADSQGRGEYLIKAVKHAGSRDGDWKTTIEVEP